MTERETPGPGGVPAPEGDRKAAPSERLAPGSADEELVLAELVSRVLDRGVVVAGEVTISVAGVDLVHLGLQLYLTSTETLRRMEEDAS